MAAYTALDDGSKTAEAYYHPFSDKCLLRTFVPDPAVSSPPYSLCVRAPGGALHNVGDLDTSSAALLMLANEMNTAVVVMDYPPGGFYLPAAEETDQGVVPDVFQWMARAVQFCRSHPDASTAIGAALWGGGSISTDPEDTILSGLSSGAYQALHCGLSMDGDWSYSRERERSESDRFVYRDTHIANVIHNTQGQVSISQFQPLTDHTVVGTVVTNIAAPPLGAGNTTVPVDGATGTIYPGSMVTFSGHDRASPAFQDPYIVTNTVDVSGGDMDILPPLEQNVGDGETVVVTVNTAISKYGAYGWAGSYLYDSEKVAEGIGFTDLSADFRKRADLDLLLVAENPRVQQVAVFSWYPPEDPDEILNEAGAGFPMGFLNRWTPGVTDPLYWNLHGPHQAYWLHWRLGQLGNTRSVMHAGGAKSNRNPSVGLDNLVDTQTGVGSHRNVFKTYLVDVLGWEAVA